MPFVVNYVVFLKDGAWTKPEGLYGIDVIVRGAGGSGSTGDWRKEYWSSEEKDDEGNVIDTHSGFREIALPGTGGGGGGMAMTESMIRASKLPDEPIPVVVGKGAPRVLETSHPSFKPGLKGGDSKFGEILFAGGGEGGGTTPYWDDRQGLLFSGLGGYAPIRGGSGMTYLTSEFARTMHSVNEWHSLAGGGGGGSGYGFEESDGDDKGNTRIRYEPWRRGGGSGSHANGANAIGATGSSYPSHWEWLQTGCGGNGGGGKGGFPSGGGGGGNGASGQGGSFSSGAGADGCVTVIEYYFVKA